MRSGKNTGLDELPDKFALSERMIFGAREAWHLLNF